LASAAISSNTVVVGHHIDWQPSLTTLHHRLIARVRRISDAARLLESISASTWRKAP
jgi:hypothetical protein